MELYIYRGDHSEQLSARWQRLNVNDEEDGEDEDEQNKTEETTQTTTA